MSDRPSTSSRTCSIMLIELADKSTFNVEKNFSEFCELFRIYRKNRREEGVNEWDWKWKLDHQPDIKKAHLERIHRFLHLFDSNQPHAHLVKDTTVILGLPPLPEGVTDTRPAFFVRDASGRNFNDRSQDGPYGYNVVDKIVDLPTWAKEFFDEMELEDLFATNWTAHYLGATVYNLHSKKYLVMYYQANLSKTEPFEYRAPNGKNSEKQK